MAVNIPLPAPDDTDWIDWATAIDTEVRLLASTAAGRALLNAVNAATQRATLSVAQDVGFTRLERIGRTAFNALAQPTPAGVVYIVVEDANL